MYSLYGVRVCFAKFGLDLVSSIIIIVSVQILLGIYLSKARITHFIMLLKKSSRLFLTSRPLKLAIYRVKLDNKQLQALWKCLHSDPLTQLRRKCRYMEGSWRTHSTCSCCILIGLHFVYILTGLLHLTTCFCAHLQADKISKWSSIFQHAVSILHVCHLYRFAALHSDQHVALRATLPNYLTHWLVCAHEKTSETAPISTPFLPGF